jgi:hypothetical protein
MNVASRIVSTTLTMMAARTAVRNPSTSSESLIQLVIRNSRALTTSANNPSGRMIAGAVKQAQDRTEQEVHEGEDHRDPEHRPETTVHRHAGQQPRGEGDCNRERDPRDEEPAHHAQRVTPTISSNITCRG